MTQQINVDISPMLPDHIDEVIRLEKRSCELPWTEKDYRRRLCSKYYYFGFIANYNERIVGLMVFQLHKEHILVLHVAADPDFRRRRIGLQLFKALRSKVTWRRKQICVHVRERNLPYQLFLRRLGFRAVAIVRRFFSNQEDAYLFRYRVRPKNHAVDAQHRSPRRAAS